MLFISRQGYCKCRPFSQSAVDGYLTAVAFDDAMHHGKPRQVCMLVLRHDASGLGKGNVLDDGTNTYIYDDLNRQITMTNSGSTAASRQRF